MQIPVSFSSRHFVLHLIPLTLRLHDEEQKGVVPNMRSNQRVLWLHGGAVVSPVKKPFCVDIASPPCARNGFLPQSENTTTQQGLQPPLWTERLATDCITPPPTTSV